MKSLQFIKIEENKPHLKLKNFFLLTSLLIGVKAKSWLGDFKEVKQVESFCSLYCMKIQMKD